MRRRILTCALAALLTASFAVAAASVLQRNRQPRPAGKLTPPPGKPPGKGAPAGAADQIAGGVTEAGRPVAGVVVLLLRGAGAAPTDELVGDVETAADGSFSFPAPPGETYHLAAGLGSAAVEPAGYDFTFTGGYASYSFVVTRGVAVPNPTAPPLPGELPGGTVPPVVVVPRVTPSPTPR